MTTKKITKSQLNEMQKLHDMPIGRWLIERIGYFRDISSDPETLRKNITDYAFAHFDSVAFDYDDNRVVGILRSARETIYAPDGDQYVDLLKHGLI